MDRAKHSGLSHQINERSEGMNSKVISQGLNKTQLRRDAADKIRRSVPHRQARYSKLVMRRHCDDSRNHQWQSSRIPTVETQTNCILRGVRNLHHLSDREHISHGLMMNLHP